MDEKGFYHGYPYWPRPAQPEAVRLTCPECGQVIQSDVTVRDDEQIVCPACYHHFDPEDE